MKIPPILPAGLCVAAGVLLVGETFRQYLAGDKFDVFFFSVGLYFAGKGLFIYSLLPMLSEYTQRNR